MQRLALTLCATLLIGWPTGPAGAADRTANTPPKRFVAVFDIACPADARIGRQMTFSIRTRLARRREQFEVIDQLTMADFTPKGGLPVETTDAKVITLISDRVGANVAIWGTLTVRGKQYELTVRLVDLTKDRTKALWRKVFTDDTERARGVIATRVVEALRGRPEWRPPEQGDEAEPKNFGKPLNVNGGFDAPGFHPRGWEKVDGISSMLTDHPGRGRVLRIYTNLDRNPWVAWRHKVRLGTGDPRKPPKIGPPKNQYAAVGAIEGVKLVSDWIDAKPGRRYWLVADVKGKTTDMFFTKIFVRGYADFAEHADAMSDVSLHERKLTPQSFAALPASRQKAIIRADAKLHPDRYRRAVYDWYLACRDLVGQEWKHHAGVVPPRGGLPANVKYLRIHAYAYWPLGEYLFDNVHLYDDPNQAVPLPEVKARSDSFKPTYGSRPKKPEGGNAK